VVVSDGMGSNDGPKFFEGPGSDGSGSGSASFESSAFASCLVEPDADIALPMFTKVDVGDDVVMLDHWE